jgi:hypothetical protein
MTTTMAVRSKRGRQTMVPVAGKKDSGEDGANEDKDKVQVGQAVVLWEAWGPHAVHIISPSSFQWITHVRGPVLLALAQIGQVCGTRF